MVIVALSIALIAMALYSMWRPAHDNNRLRIGLIADINFNMRAISMSVPFRSGVGAVSFASVDGVDGIDGIRSVCEAMSNYFVRTETVVAQNRRHFPELPNLAETLGVLMPLALGSGHQIRNGVRIDGILQDNVISEKERLFLENLRDDVDLIIKAMEHVEGQGKVNQDLSIAELSGMLETFEKKWTISHSDSPFFLLVSDTVWQSDPAPGDSVEQIAQESMSMTTADADSLYALNQGGLLVASAVKSFREMFGIGEWIYPADSVDMEGMNLYWQNDGIQTKDDDNAKLSIYVRADKDDDGEFVWDDGQDWLMVMESSLGNYPLSPRRYLQFGGLSCMIYTGQNEASGSWDAPRVLVTVIQGAGYWIYDCVFDTKRGAFYTVPVYYPQGGQLSYFGRY